MLSFSKYTGKIAVKYYFLLSQSRDSIFKLSRNLLCQTKVLLLSAVNFFIKCYQFLQSLFFCWGVFFLGFLLLRNMFLLLGILTWLSVRVSRGSFGYLSQVFDRKKGTKYWGTENCRRQRIPNGIVPSLSYKHFMCENPAFQFVSSEKRHFQGLDVIRDGNIHCANSTWRFFAIYRGVPKCCDYQGSNSMSQEVWNVSVWSYFTSGSEGDRTSKWGWCFKKYFLGTNMWAHKSAFRLYKQKTLLKILQFI